MPRQLTTLLRCALLFLAATAPAGLHAQETRGSVEGTAIDANGAVIPSANVSLACECSECPNLPCDQCCPEGFSRSATADDEGRFRLADIPPGVYTVRGEARGFAAVEVRGVRITASAAQTVVLQFRPSGGDPDREVVGNRSAQQSSQVATLVQGRVVDEANNGEPVAGATVTLQLACNCLTECPNSPCEICCPQTATLTATTDARGEFNVSAPAGSYRVLSVAGDYSKDLRLRITGNSRKRLRIRMALGRNRQRTAQ